MKVKAKKDEKKPSVRDAIKAIQIIPGKNLKRKKNIESSDSDESMEKNLAPKKNPSSRAPTESDDNLPAPPKRRAVRPASIDEEDNSEEDLAPKEGAKKNKGKGKEIQPDNKGKATIKGADQTRGGNVPKLKRSVDSGLIHLIRIHLVTCLYFR
jgi:hypothetical protein